MKRASSPCLHTLNTWDSSRRYALCVGPCVSVRYLEIQPNSVVEEGRGARSACRELYLMSSGCWACDGGRDRRHTHTHTHRENYYMC